MCYIHQPKKAITLAGRVLWAAFIVQVLSALWGGWSMPGLVYGSSSSSGYYSYLPISLIPLHPVTAPMLIAVMSVASGLTSWTIVPAKGSVIYRIWNVLMMCICVVLAITFQSRYSLWYMNTVAMSPEERANFQNTPVPQWVPGKELLGIFWFLALIALAHTTTLYTVSTNVSDAGEEHDDRYELPQVKHYQPSPAPASGSASVPVQAPASPATDGTPQKKRKKNREPATRGAANNTEG